MNLQWLVVVPLAEAPLLKWTCHQLRQPLPPGKLRPWFSGLSGNGCTVKPQLGTGSVALQGPSLRSEGTWEWADRRVENTAASRLLLSVLRPPEGPLGTLLGPLGCPLLLGKGSYWGPLLPARTKGPSVSCSSSQGALSFCLQLIREHHTPSHLVPGRGLYNRRAETAAPSSQEMLWLGQWGAGSSAESSVCGQLW